jgi:N-acyl-D-aspartate/D-glutamate deacylase
LAIEADRIVEIAPNISSHAAKQCIDITGKVVSPGFIDVHTHDDNAVLKKPECLAKISQGVTTVIVGNCGLSAAPVRLTTAPPDPLNLLGNREDFTFPSFKDYADKVNLTQPSVNVAALIGHTSLRVNHMSDLNRAATSEELANMCRELQQCLEEGAIGMSTGLAYASANCAPTEEIIRLAKVVAEQDGVYATHMRDEFDKVVEAIDESLNIGESADLPVIISHLKCAGPDNWGRSKEVLGHIDHSPYKDRVHMDCYPYAAGSSTLDLKQVDERVDILITWSESYPEQGTKYLSEIAKDWKLSQLETAKKLQPAGAVYFSIDEDDMKAIISHPRTMIGSDGLPHDPHPHPRLWGTFPRVLGKLSREEQLFNLPQALHKMTGMAAQKFKLPERGLLQENYFADLVVFDPERICDNATFETPIASASGIEHVFVNGVESYPKHKNDHRRAGRYLSKSLF